MTSGFVHGNGVDLHYQISGDGDQTLVLINGVGDDSGGWANQVDEFVRAGLRVVSFDNRGVGASSGAAPDTVEAMADDAYAFITALGYDRIDVFSFSLGGMVAQALVVKHPELVRKLVLTGTGPKGGKGIDKVAGVTYRDMLRAALTRSDPKEFLFFNRNAAGTPAARAFVGRLAERTVDRDAPIKPKAFLTQLKAIKRWSRRSRDPSWETRRARTGRSVGSTPAPPRLYGSACRPQGLRRRGTRQCHVARLHALGWRWVRFAAEGYCSSHPCWMPVRAASWAKDRMV